MAAWIRKHALGVVIVIAVIMAIPFALRFVSGDGLDRSHLEADGTAKEWFEHPNTGHVLNGPSERLKTVDQLVVRISGQWVDRGLDVGAVKHVSTSLKNTLDFIFASDVESLLTDRKISGLQPTQAAIARLNNSYSKMQNPVIQHGRRWDQMSNEEKYAYMVDNDPEYTIPIEAVGGEIITSVGDEPFVMPKGYLADSVGASYLPKPRLKSGKPRYTSGRVATCMLPVRVEGLGDVWLQITFEENISDAYWHVLQVAVLTSQDMAPDHSYLLAM